MRESTRSGLLVSFLIVAVLLAAAPGCAPPPPPKFRVLMVTDGDRGLAGLELTPWREWRDGRRPSRPRYLAAPAFRLADRLMDRGDMVIDVASADSAGLRADKIGGYGAVIVDVGSGPCAWSGGPQVLARAVQLGAGLVVLGGSAAAFGEDADWCRLLGAKAGPPRSGGLTPLAVLDSQHPATFDLGAVWQVADALCGVTGLSPDARILIRTATSSPGQQSSEPVAWTRQVGRGRVFVLTFGHEPAVRDRQEFVTVIHDAVRWTGHLVEERHNQLTLGERKAGFEPLLAGIGMNDCHGWTTNDGELVGRLDTGAGAFFTRTVSSGLADLRFDFMPVKGQALLRIAPRDGGNDNRPGEPPAELRPAGQHGRDAVARRLAPGTGACEREGLASMG